MDKKIKLMLYQKQGGKCANPFKGRGICDNGDPCNGVVPILNGQIFGDVDHIIPRCISRDDSMQNLQLLCTTCHAIKTRRALHGDWAQIKRFKGWRHTERPQCYVCKKLVPKDFMSGYRCMPCYLKDCHSTRPRKIDQVPEAPEEQASWFESFRWKGKAE
jgi:hypothetical protein